MKQQVNSKNSISTPSQKQTINKSINGHQIYDVDVEFSNVRMKKYSWWHRIFNPSSIFMNILLRISKIVIEFFVIFMIILSISFFLINSIPGSSSLTAGLDEAQRAAIENRYGLNLPLGQRFFLYLKNFFQGDFGISLSLLPSVPINDFIWQRFYKSFLIGIFSVGLTIGLGIPLGIYIGKNPGGLIDNASTFFISLFSSIPSLILGLLLIIVGRLIGLPYIFEHTNLLTYILPGLALSLGSIAIYVKWLRTGLNEELNSMHAKFAYLKGLRKSHFVWKHALRPSLFPIAVYFPFVILGSFVGSIFLENLFSITGSGGLLLQGIQSKDYNVVLFLLSIGVLTSIIGYMLRDILLELLDPRLRLKKG